MANIIVPSDKPMLVDANGEPLDPSKPGHFYDGGTEGRPSPEWSGKGTNMWVSVMVTSGKPRFAENGGFGNSLEIPHDVFQDEEKMKYLADWTGDTIHEGLRKAGL